MTATVEDDPFKEAGTELVLAIGEFDETRHALYDFVSELTTNPKPFGEYQEEISAKASEASEAFVDIVNAFLKSECDKDEKADRIKQLWSADEAERKELFSKLSGCDDFLCPETDEHDCVELAYADALLEGETEADIVHKIDEFYSTELTDDIEHLVSHITDRFESLPPPVIPRRQWIARNAGKYALDVSKIAAGVGIGELIVRVLH